MRVPPRTWRATELLASAVFAVLTLTVAAGACTASGGSPPATVATGPAEPQFQFTATATPMGGLAGATAVIVFVLIVAAAAIGLIFYRPGSASYHRPRTPETPQRPRRGGAAGTRPRRSRESMATGDYSSSAPGAVFAICIRNSTLLLDFFRRSISRSMA